MATHTQEHAQRRVDLETIVGVSPIHCAFHPDSKALVYSYGLLIATIDCHYQRASTKEISEWFDLEVKTCKEAFLPDWMKRKA